MESECCRDHFCVKWLRMPEAAYQYKCQSAVIWCCSNCRNNISNKKLRKVLDKRMENTNPMITDMYKFIAGSSQRTVDKNTEVWKELTISKFAKKNNRSNRRSRRKTEKEKYILSFTKQKKVWKPMSDRKKTRKNS